MQASWNRIPLDPKLLQTTFQLQMQSRAGRRFHPWFMITETDSWARTTEIHAPPNSKLPAITDIPVDYHRGQNYYKKDFAKIIVLAQLICKNYKTTSLYKANSFACSLVNRDKPLATSARMVIDSVPSVVKLLQIYFGRRDVKMTSQKSSWRSFGRCNSYRGFDWFLYRNFLELGPLGE